MKKLLAITLLLIHLFNLSGYSFLFRYFIEQSSKQLSQKIDKNNYDEADLVEMKVLLNMPYFTQTAEYERFDGEIDIEGQHHHYVKRKISGDTLYILCLPNAQNDKLQLAKTEFGKKVNDFDSKEKNDFVKKANIGSEYNQHTTEYRLVAPEILATSHLFPFTSDITDTFIGKHGKPPRINS